MIWRAHLCESVKSVVLFFLFGLENLAQKTRFYNLVTQREYGEVYSSDFYSQRP